MAGLALAGYVAYSYLKRSSEKSRAERAKNLEGAELLEYNLEEDIRRIGDVTKNDSGLIPFDQFIQMFIIIRHHAKVKLEVAVEGLKAKRREALS